MALTRAARVGGRADRAVALAAAARGDARRAPADRRRWRRTARWLCLAAAARSRRGAGRADPRRPRPARRSRPARASSSVTQIETWIRDPYAIYARHILELEPLDPIDADAGRRPIAAPSFTPRSTASSRDIRANCRQDALTRLIAIGRRLFGELRRAAGRSARLLVAALRADRPLVHRPRSGQRRRQFVAARDRGRGQDRARRARRALPACRPRPTASTGCADGTLPIIDYKTGAPPNEKEIAAGLQPAASAGGGDCARPGASRASMPRRVGGSPSGGCAADDEPGERQAGQWPARRGSPRRRWPGLPSSIAAFDDPATPYAALPRPAPGRPLHRLRAPRAGQGVGRGRRGRTNDRPPRSEIGRTADQAQRRRQRRRRLGLGRRLGRHRQDQGADRPGAAACCWAAAEPERILCLTFTRPPRRRWRTASPRRWADWAAAADADWRRGWPRSSDMPPDPDEHAPGAPALRARARSRRAACSIQTIHGFCQSLLARFPLEAGVPPALSRHRRAHRRRVAGRDGRRGAARAPATETEPKLARRWLASPPRRRRRNFASCSASSSRSAAACSGCSSRHGGVDGLAAAVRRTLDIAEDATVANLIAAACRDGAFDAGGLRRAAAALASGSKRQSRARGGHPCDWLARPDPPGRSLRPLPSASTSPRTEIDGELSRPRPRRRSAWRVEPSCSRGRAPDCWTTPATGCGIADATSGLLTLGRRRPRRLSAAQGAAGRARL